MKRARKKYAKLNHLLINVRDAARSRDWYVKNLGLKVEFEVPENGFVALEDDWGMALLISQGKPTKGAASGSSSISKSRTWTRATEPSRATV